MPLASGEFDVKLQPEPLSEVAAGAGLGRLSLDKQFYGDLDGASHGEMLSAMTGTEGSAGYVALERFTGTLGGREGSFALQHSGTMRRGTPTLSVTVVPDSGTGQLQGLDGRLIIRIEQGKHLYEFDYTLTVS